MNRLIKHISSVALIALLLSGCQKDSISEQSSPTTDEVVLCSLSLGIETMVSSQIETRSEAASSVPTAVKNLWIIQLDGSNKVVGTPKYIEDISESGALTDIELVATESDQPIIYLANSFAPNLSISTGTTLDQIKEYSSNSYSYTDTYDTEYLFMSYYTKTRIMSGSNTLECALEYNVAKVDYTITNNAEGLKIESVQMCNVPTAVKYFMYYEPDTPFPALRDHTDLTEIAVANNQSPITGSIYMPANLQGDCVGQNSLVQNKPTYVPTNNCTYLLVTATDSNDQTLEYRFYLGEDLIDDYNIKSNNYYIYNIEINDIGNIESDARITIIDNEQIDYTNQKPSNCYIINPKSYQQVIYIPVIERINEFWGGNGYENNPNKVINSGEDWSVEYIFYDNDALKSSGNLEITLTAMAEAPSGREALKLTVPADFDGEGNFTVMVKKGTEKLWSWHFWVTDYNPDEVPTRVTDYQYTVTGGEVHRYDGDVWENGAYVGKYIMDRPLGASSNGSDQKILFYQFGRKDPMCHSTKSNSRTYNTGYSNGSVYAIYSTTITDVIENPDKFYKTTYTIKYSWLGNGNSYTDPTNTVWCDPTLTAATTSDETEGKSIFDPSPLGWKVPGLFTWDGFSSVNQSYDSSTGAYTFSGGGKSIVYYNTGAINYDNEMYTGYGRFWMSNRYLSDDTSILRASIFNFYENYAERINTGMISYACPIMCVQE